ncbi:hypothetical protein [Psychroflexus halocasei]|nr:hypothetical protein [Psychroflexus halocasei]
MIKNNATIKIMTAQLILMSLMLIFSHCSLRHTIEANLNLDKSNASSQLKIQKTQAQKCCRVDFNKTRVTKSKPYNHQQFLFAGVHTDLSFQKPLIIKLPLVIIDRKVPKLQAVPLYILYQNMRCFIS